jgi:hypothetical protein
MKLKRASRDQVQQNALPILLEGFKKRKKLRSSVEEKYRNKEKLDRDKKYTTEPHLSSI